jgi:hypothetical protein
MLGQQRALFIILRIIKFQTSIIVSGIVGAYIFTVPLDHYVGSNLKYIFLNVLRRATDEDFGTAIVQPPFQTLGNLIIQFR